MPTHLSKSNRPRLQLPSPCGKDRHTCSRLLSVTNLHAAPGCRSSVVEHPLGKGEVVSSILTGSTRKSRCCRSFYPSCRNCIWQPSSDRNRKRPQQYVQNPCILFTPCSRL